MRNYYEAILKKEAMQMKRERSSCRRCAEWFRQGDTYYEVPMLGAYCPDCMDGLLSGWRRTEGDEVDRL